MDKSNLILSEILAQKVYKSVAVLDKAVWQKVNRALVCKSLAELMHEMLITPSVTEIKNGITFFKLDTDVHSIAYHFRAEHKSLDYWYIHPGSICKTENDKEVGLNALDFFTEMQQAIGIKPHTLTRFLEEIHRTLYADCYLEHKSKLNADELADADYQQIEQHMTGHPWLIMNKGRVGFGYDDYTRNAPESGNEIKLLWLAVERSHAAFNSMKDVSYEELMQTELDEELVCEFREILSLQALDAASYYFMPVHEWQWNNKLVFLFASEIAVKHIVPLAFGNDAYYAQQSIRTLYNKTLPGKHYVKTALTILNTTLYRGLSPAKLKMAPVMAAWVEKKLAHDIFLEQNGFSLLKEVATMSYSHPHFSKITGGPYQFNEMLGVIWRESMTGHLKPGEKALTMAALLYTDGRGKALVQSFVEKSGLSTERWIEAYLSAYFKPLLHCFYRHQMFFVPHGENIILVMKDYVPVRVILKDFVEEVQLAPDTYKATPEDIRNILYPIPEEDVTLFIFVDIFVGFFRFLSSLLSVNLGYPEEIFWKQVAAVIVQYQKQFPEMEGLYKRYDLFSPEFKRFCLNRFRLVTFGYDESSSVPAEPPYAGVLGNPIADFKRIKEQEEIAVEVYN